MFFPPQTVCLVLFTRTQRPSSKSSRWWGTHHSYKAWWYVVMEMYFGKMENQRNADAEQFHQATPPSERYRGPKFCLRSPCKQVREWFVLCKKERSGYQNHSFSTSINAWESFGVRGLRLPASALRPIAGKSPSITSIARHLPLHLKDKRASCEFPCRCGERVCDLHPSCSSVAVKHMNSNTHLNLISASIEASPSAAAERCHSQNAT